MGGRFDALNGEPLESPFGTGPPPGARGKAYTADRTTTRNFLLRGLEREISFGKSLVKYEETEEGVSPFSGDGTEVCGSFLVGAEGVNSVVRKQYLPKHVVLDTECRCIYGKTRITKEFLDRFDQKAMEGMTVLFNNSRGRPMILLFEAIRFQDNDLRSELPEDYMYWVLGGSREDFLRPDDELLHLPGSEVSDLTLKITALWQQSYRPLLELQEKDMTSALRISMASPEMPGWESSSKVALIGDAAHVMPPTGGVGANTALQDAAALYEVLKQDMSKNLVAEYDEGMRKRAREAITGSVGGGKHLLDFGTAATSSRAPLPLECAACPRRQDSTHSCLWLQALMLETIHQRESVSMQSQRL